jgi:hypothetical protein
MTSSYSFRSSLVTREETFTLDGRSLAISNRSTIDFADIRQIRTYDSPGVNLVGVGPVAPALKTCVIRLKNGRPLSLSSNHFLALANFEDRSATYEPFVAELIREVAAANATTVFISGMRMALWISWISIVAMAFVIVPLLIFAAIGMVLDGKSISIGMLFSGLLLLGIVIGVRPLVRALKRNRPRRYDPRGSPRSL